MQVKRYYGHQACELGVAQVLTCGPCAGALCLGGAPKRYGNSVCNEDALLLANGSCGSLVAVADAHYGAEASELVFDWLVEHQVSDWTKEEIDPDRWQLEAISCLERINEYILASCKRSNSSSQTTLVIGIIQARSRLAFVASAGDSHAFLVSRSNTTEIAITPAAGDFFLGTQSLSIESLTAACAFCSASIEVGEALMLASDGISTNGIGFADPAKGIRTIMETVPVATGGRLSRHLATAAVEATCRVQELNNSGDNIAIAVASFPQSTP